MIKRLILFVCSYIYNEKFRYLFFISIFFVYYAIIYLHNQNVESVKYAFYITLLIGLIVESVRLYNYYVKYKKIYYIHKSFPYYDIENIKDISLDKIESLYKKIILDMNEIIYMERNKAYRTKKDILDYYTVWIHQIKTPISVMTLLLDEEDNRKSYILKNELFKIEEYINMSLGYLRLDKDVSDLLIKQYSLDDIVRSVIRKYRNQFILKNIKIEYKPIDATIFTDSKWLKLMVEQIISNSIKYTEEGSVKIWYTNNRLSIEDTGIGVSQEDIPRIFEKGYTGYNGRLEEKSTGLGLYLAQTIAEKLDVKIEFESTKGKGSKVSILFPKKEYIDTTE